MYTNEKMRLAEIIPVMWGGIKESDGRGESNYDVFKNFGKCHNVPPV
jgi:hypothetical protein